MRKKALASAACAAAIGLLAALPGPAAANSCGSVQGEENGVEFGGGVDATGTSCRNAKRVARKCVIEGELVDGWGTRFKASKGILKLTKGDKLVLVTLAGGEPPHLDDCLAANDGL